MNAPHDHESTAGEVLRTSWAPNESGQVVGDEFGELVG